MAVLPQDYDLNELLFPGDSGAPITYGSVDISTGTTITASTEVPLVRGAEDNAVNVTILGGDVGTINPNDFSVTAISPDRETSVRLPVQGITAATQPNSFKLTPGLPENFVDGSQVVVSYLGAESNSLPVANGTYPTLPVYEANQASEELLGLYAQAGAALSGAGGGGQSDNGTLEGILAASGKVTIDAKDDILRKEALRGAAKETATRYGGLTELLNGNHIADEVLKLGLWTASMGLGNLDVADQFRKYKTTLAYSMSRLGFIMKKYDFTNKGSVVVQSSNAYNSSAQSHRFNSGTVFDIYAPTTMINTEYLIQQSSNATLRQTGIDQLSCFYRWHRAEEAMINQTKKIYNYTTDQVINGGNALDEVYNVATYKYLDGVNVHIGGFGSPLGGGIGGAIGGAVGGAVGGAIGGAVGSAASGGGGSGGGGGSSSGGGGSSSGGGGGSGEFSLDGTEESISLDGVESALGGAGDVAGSAVNAGIDAAQGGIDALTGGELPGLTDPIKSNYTLSATGNVNLFSLLGRLLVKAKDSVLAMAENIVLDATKDIFIRAAEKLALESKHNLNITCREGQLIIDAEEIIFRSPRPIQFNIGEGPMYMQETIAGLYEIENPDLMRLPELFVTAVEDLAPIDEIPAEGGEAIGVEGPAEGGGRPHAGVAAGAIDEIPAEGAVPIEVEEVEELITEGPLIKYVVIVEQTPDPSPGMITSPYPLMGYPTSPLPAPVAQPNNGIVASPVYPAA
jgi:uncharacterized membrane protein YgcG